MESSPFGAIRMAVSLLSSIPSIQFEPKGLMNNTFIGYKFL